MKTKTPSIHPDGSCQEVFSEFPLSVSTSQPITNGPSGLREDKKYGIVQCVYGEHVYLTNGKNIRRWGTTKGLGELLKGPLSNTVTDPVEGKVTIPARAVIHFLAVKKGW